MKTTKELVKFDIETAVITALDAEYKEVQKITDAKSKTIVAEGRRKYRELRLAVVDGHKDEKREALDHCNFLDAEKRRILGLLAPGESHLDDIWQAHKDEIDRKERERIEAIQEKINGIRHLGAVYNLASSHIEERLVIVKDMQVSEDVYMEFTNQAIQTHKDSVSALEQALAERLQFEKEEAERKAETERLETQRKEQEVAQAKIDRANEAAAKRQAEDDARMAAKQAKIDEENRIIKEEFAKLAADKKVEEDRKEREEFKRQAKIQAENEAKKEIERHERERLEKEEAQAKEKTRQAEMAPDREKLIKFADELRAILIPKVKSAKAIKIFNEISNRLIELADLITEQAKEL